MEISGYHQIHGQCKKTQHSNHARLVGGGITDLKHTLISFQFQQVGLKLKHVWNHYLAGASSDDFSINSIGRLKSEGTSNNSHKPLVSINHLDSFGIFHLHLTINIKHSLSIHVYIDIHIHKFKYLETSQFAPRYNWIGRVHGTCLAAGATTRPVLIFLITSRCWSSRLTASPKTLNGAIVYLPYMKNPRWTTQMCKNIPWHWVSKGMRLEPCWTNVVDMWICNHCFRWKQTKTAGT